MTLYEFFGNAIYEYNGACDFDVWDTVFDECVTVCVPDEIADDYDRFIKEISKHVELVSSGSGEDFEIIADWFGLIEKNEETLRAWTKENWSKGNYKDLEDYADAWIKELNLWMAGYLPDEMYTEVYELAKRLK